MALLNTWGADNRVVTNDKVVTYSTRLIYGSWSYVSPDAPNITVTINSAYEYHRYCSKSYMYVGMDRATAGACAQAMITKYTRSFSVSEWNSSGQNAGQFTDTGGGSYCMAEVCVQQREGCMYDVLINVREDDTRLRTSITSPEALFAAENNRDYDEN